MPKINKFKVVFVGDQNVGKTSIISRFIHDSFEQSSNPTVGIDFITKTMQVEGQTLRLQLWDTAGQQRFRSLIPSYIRDSDMCLIIVDLGARSSYQGLNKWTDFVRQTRGQDGLIFLVGNKSDIKDRQITTKQMEQYSENNNYPYLQVSAKSGTNIQQLFRKVSETLMEGKKQQSQNKAQRKTDSKSQPVNKDSKQANIILNKKQATQSVQNGGRTCQC